MKTITIDILQDVASSCLNRDDSGEHKTAIYGGVPRLRVSSQCMKRQIRSGHEKVIGTSTPNDVSTRTKFFPERIRKSMLIKGHTDKAIKEVLSSVFGKIEVDKQTKDLKVSTLQMLSKQEEDAIISAVDDALTNQRIEAPGFADIIKEASARCGSSIAIYGRMFADDPELSIEGASYHSQMLTTHEAEPESDYFTAMDESSNGEGASHLDTKSFGSGVFYRCHVLDINTLKANLQDSNEIPNLIEGYIRAVVEAFPTARQHTDFAVNLPSYVAVTIKDKGQAISMMDSYSKPIKGENILEESIKAIQLRRQIKNRTYGNPGTTYELNILDSNTLSLENILTKVREHV